MARPGRVFEFPRDHGSHPEFRIEWWYVTGHLDSADGRRFAFQITFFRQAKSLGDETMFMAHATLFDGATKQFIQEERLAREGWDAAASQTTLDVRHANWSLRMAADGTIHINATIRSEAALELSLSATKPLVVFGQDGVCRKGAAPEAASHYLTFPRLAGRGIVRMQGARHETQAVAWMDHEFSSSQLDAGQVGWDWTCMQLNDGTEAMIYRMRRPDGSSDPAGGMMVWIDMHGSQSVLPPDAFDWTALRTWTSPLTRAAYPVAVRIKSPDRVVELRPLTDAAELKGELSGLPYWEGACDVLSENGAVIGRAFLELTGYSGDLARRLREEK